MSLWLSWGNKQGVASVVDPTGYLLSILRLHNHNHTIGHCSSIFLLDQLLLFDSFQLRVDFKVYLMLVVLRL